MRSSEVDVVLTGERLDRPEALVLYAEGLEVVSLEAADPKRCTIRLRVPAACRLGEHLFRLRTAAGLSNLLTFRVGLLPEIAETEPNDEPQSASALRLAREKSPRASRWRAMTSSTQARSKSDPRSFCSRSWTASWATVIAVNSACLGLASFWSSVRAAS